MGVRYLDTIVFQLGSNLGSHLGSRCKMDSRCRGVGRGVSTLGRATGYMTVWLWVLTPFRRGAMGRGGSELGGGGGAVGRWGSGVVRLWGCGV